MNDEKARKAARAKAALIKQIKSLIGPTIACILIACAVVFVILYQSKEVPQEPIEVRSFSGDDKPVVLENSKLKFTMDPLTTQFEVLVKDTGKVWRSNPEDADNDPLALKNEKGRLQSTFLMTYTQVAGLEVEFNNYDASIKNQIYEVNSGKDENGNDYIRVDYSVGNIEKEYVIPPVSTVENYDKWMGNLDKTGQNIIKKYYKLYDINNLGKRDNKEELLANYPALEEQNLYVLREGVKDNLLTKMEELFEEAGYTYADFEADKELTNAEKTSDNPIFNVSMIYRLDGEDLILEVPLKDIQSKNEYPIYTFEPLPYFGAADTEDTGFMFVPEGGGAIINYNNGKTSQNGYYANMYGWDMALVRDAVVHNTRSYFNVYGTADTASNNSFLCVLEEGAAYASVYADISGKNNSYNTVGTEYTITFREKYDVGSIAASDVYVFIPELPDESLIQRYRFIDSADYTDMAKEYQGYLMDTYGDALTKNDDASTPVAIEIVGAVDKVKQILGVPVSRPLKLTTYKETKQILEELKAQGVNNMSVKMTGWMNGGIKQKILKKAKPISSLGSSKDLKNLADYAKSNDIDLYLEGVTHYEYDSKIYDGFFSYTDAAKFVSKKRAELFVYSDVTYAAREGVDSYYLLHADLIKDMINNLDKTADKYGTGVAFKDTGMDLSADYYRKKMTSRQAALESQSEQLKQISESGNNVMINMGNDYAAVYSDMITNMDLQGSAYTIIDEFVPFYQMALHGYVNYTGVPLNLAGNTEEQLLNSAEYGAGLSFSLMKESAFALQKTLYTEYYGSDYDAWHDRLLEIYNRYNSELGHTFNQEMVGHKAYSETLKCSIYADGTKVYVNYSSEQQTTPDGVVVPARDYKVVR